MAVFLKDLSFEIPIIHNRRYCQLKRILSERRYYYFRSTENNQLLLTLGLVVGIIEVREMFRSREFGCF